MAKILETIFRISGELSGSFMGAIATAQGALRGLTRAGTGRFGASFEVGERRLQSMLKRLKETQNALEQFKRLQAAGPGQSGFTKYATEIRKAAEELRRLGVNIKNLDGSSATLRRMIDELRTAQARNRAINDVLAAQRRTSEQHQNFSAAWSNMSNAVTTAQSVLSPLAGSTQTAMQYEAELSRSRALTQMDNINAGRTVQIEREMKMLDERYKEIGRTTRYSAIEAERAGNYLAMAGFTAEQINSGLASMVNLGIANNTELDRTADIFSNIATSMRIEKSEAGYQRLADRTTYLTTHSNQTLTMLDDTMKYVAPIASAMKIDIDDLYSAQKFMVDSGVRGSMAGTALKSFILRSVAPPKKAMEALAEAGIMTPEEMNQNAAFQELMAEEGISIENRQEGESVLMSLIRQYSEKSKDWSDARKTSFIEAWAGKYAAPGVMAMLENGGYEKILAFNRGLKNSDGAAAQTAGVMSDNLQGSWLSLQSALESLSIEAGGAFVPAARSMTEMLTTTVRSASAFASENRGLISVLGGVATAAGAAIAGLGAFRLVTAGLSFLSTTAEMLKVTAAIRGLSGMGSAVGGLIGRFGGLTTVLGGVGRALAALAGPWGIALAAAATVVIANWDKVGSFFNNLGDRISRTLSGISKKASGLLGGLMDGTIFEAGFTAEGHERKEQAKEIYRANTTLRREESDAATLATRNAVRSESDATAIGKAIATELRSIENQTGARQDALLERVSTELASRKEISAETVSSVLSTVKTELSGLRQDTSATLMRAFEETARSESRDAFMGRLESTLETVSAANVTQADRVTTALLSIADRDKGTDVTTKLDAITEYVQSQSNITETFKGEILSAVRERMQEETTARIGDQVATAIKETTDQSALTEQLTTILMAQEDRSSASVEMMLTTVESALEATGQRSSEEITAMMEALTTSMATAQEEQRQAAAETFTQLQTSANDTGLQLELTGQLAQQLGVNSEQAGQMVQLLNGASSEASGNVQGMSAAAADVASALSAKAGEIGSIAINVPQVNYMPVTVPIPTAGAAIPGHASGGIFPRGAHLTWFAEDSAEAAIPLDGSKRSETLWTKVGRMMGILPEVKQTPKPVSIASGSRVKLPWWLPEKWKPKKKTPAPTAAPLPAGVPVPAGYPTAPEEPMAEKIKPPQPSIGRAPTPTFPMSRLPFPLTTPPYVGRTPRKVDGKTLEEALHETERLDREEATFERSTTSVGMTPAGDLPITVNITFNGSVDREETKAGVMEGLEAMLERLRHEQARRAYA